MNNSICKTICNTIYNKVSSGAFLYGYAVVALLLALPEVLEGAGISMPL